MRNATIGYDLKRAHWGKGIATEAVREAIRAAFAGLLACGPLHRIQADTIPGNLASERLLLKLGFKEEGTRRECAYLKGEYHDMKCFGLIRPDFRQTGEKTPADGRRGKTPSDSEPITGGSPH
jgi:ribosomal-protein-alanine N-acetyltransferase